MSDEYTLDQARRMRRYLGQLCEQHALDCGICASPNMFMCDELRRLLAIKARWIRRIMELVP